MTPDMASHCIGSSLAVALDSLAGRHHALRRAWHFYRYPRAGGNEEQRSDDSAPLRGRTRRGGRVGLTPVHAASRTIEQLACHEPGQQE